MNIPSEKELFKAGVHFGHKPSSWHPKMADFIFGQKNGVNIIDLEKTKQKLEETVKFINELFANTEGENQPQILFVGTRPQVREIIKKHAIDCDMPYIEKKWLGGTLTNHKVINGLVKKLNDLEKNEQKEDYAQKYTKKERLDFSQEIIRLKEMVGGIRYMKGLPKAIFISSTRYEKTAVSEATKKQIPTIGICDTNSNPTKVNLPIPGNDDAVKSLELLTSIIAKTIKENKK